MRQFLWFMCIVYLVYTSIRDVYGENCNTVNDCTVTACSSGGTLMCTHEGKCTCGVQCRNGTSYTHACGNDPKIPDSAECQIWYEFEADHSCECQDGHLHCIDSLCHCGFPPN
ncbi:serine protease inhibitor Cvsi-2-like [Gigantopelta aegis]|uniref:serine protease inhibitor Cvsi-2-like n=1 Tax=Gigantopelta aegis TaxID=1735272 RepID=UPI001B887F49|nr:serine protease inhibitor Cvsi-2-like [Gigantopelta aegis]